MRFLYKTEYFQGNIFADVKQNIKQKQKQKRRPAEVECDGVHLSSAQSRRKTTHLGICNPSSTLIQVGRQSSCCLCDSQNKNKTS